MCPSASAVMADHAVSPWGMGVPRKPAAMASANASPPSPVRPSTAMTGIAGVAASAVTHGAIRGRLRMAIATPAAIVLRAAAVDTSQVP